MAFPLNRTADDGISEGQDGQVFWPAQKNRGRRD
jgi:hypothetical protein